MHQRKHNQSYDPEYNGRYIGHDEPSLLFYFTSPVRAITTSIQSPCPETRRSIRQTLIAKESDSRQCGISNCIRRSGWGWPCATPSHFPNSVTIASLIPMTTFLTAVIPRRSTTSGATLEQPSWKCNSSPPGLVPHRFRPATPPPSTSTVSASVVPVPTAPSSTTPTVRIRPVWNR